MLLSTERRKIRNAILVQAVLLLLLLCTETMCFRYYFCSKGPQDGNSCQVRETTSVLFFRRTNLQNAGHFFMCIIWYDDDTWIVPMLARGSWLKYHTVEVTIACQVTRERCIIYAICITTMHIYARNCGFYFHHDMWIRSLDGDWPWG